MCTIGRVMAEANYISYVIGSKLGVNRSTIPEFSGKASELKPWLVALKKEAKFYKLTEKELINLAFNYAKGVALEWIGCYLKERKT